MKMMWGESQIFFIYHWLEPGEDILFFALDGGGHSQGVKQGYVNWNCLDVQKFLSYLIPGD